MELVPQLLKNTSKPKQKMNEKMGYSHHPDNIQPYYCITYFSSSTPQLRFLFALILREDLPRQ